MIYLIGGSPRCGKTILSKTIARAKKISYISTDSLREVIYNSIPKSDIDEKFPQQKMKSPTKFLFEMYAAKDLLKAQVKESESMWPGIKALIDLMTRRQQDCVIEGAHLLPKYVSKLKGVKIVYLVKTSTDRIIEGFSKNKEPDWMYPSIRGNQQKIAQAAEMVSSRGQYFAKEADKFNLKVINTEINFKKRLRQAKNYLLKS